MKPKKKKKTGKKNRTNRERISPSRLFYEGNNGESGDEMGVKHDRSLMGGK